jgi:hypothetical protein
LSTLAGVDRAFGAAGADQRVQLVDEQDRVLGAADLVHHRLDAFFELAAVLGAGDHHGQVEHDDPLVGQQFGHVAGDDRWAKPSTMAVLPTPASPSSTGLFLVRRQRIWIALDFLLAADDRIELALLGQFGQVAAEAVQRRRLRLAPFGCCPLAPAAATPAPRSPSPPRAVAEQVEHFLADVFELQPEVHQHLGGDAFLLAQQAQQDVLGADVVVVQVAGLFHRILDDLLGPRRLRQLAHGDHVGPLWTSFSTSSGSSADRRRGSSARWRRRRCLP